MESHQEAPRAPPRRRAEERSGNPSSLTSLDGSDHPALRAQEFHRLHRSAIEITAEAQILDGDGKREEAFKAYNRALHFIDQAVGLAHEGGFDDSDVNKIDDLTYKLRITRKQIMERVGDLQIGSTSEQEMDSYLQGPGATTSSTMSTSGGSFSMGTPAYSSLGPAPTPRNPLPSYEDAVRGYNEAAATTSSRQETPRSLNYSDLVSALDDIASEQASLANPLPLNAHEVFTINENVQIYFISNDDNVSAPSYPSFLRVVVTDQSSGKFLTNKFAQYF